MSELNNTIHNNTTEQPRDERGRWTRRSPEPIPEAEIMEDFAIEEDLPEIADVDCEQEPQRTRIFIDDEEDSGNGGDNHNVDGDCANNGGNRSGCLWAVIVILMILALSGHIVWCLTHHMGDQMCTTCNKVEAECVCAEVRTGLLEQIAELEAQLQAFATSTPTTQMPTVTPVPTTVVICRICGSLDSCNCKTEYEKAVAQNEYIHELINSGKCTGLCPIHCVEATVKPTKAPTVTPNPTKAPTVTPNPTKAPATATPNPTKAPATATPNPTKAPATATPNPTKAPATATPNPTKAPATATPTARPTATPCMHPNTTKVEGPRTDYDNGEWLQEMYKVCTHCGEVVDIFYRGGINVDAAIPTDPNSWEYEDDGEAGKPIT